jgi:hypothetical protein
VSAYDDRFKAALSEDVRHVYEKGLGEKARRESMPALAELAEAVCATPNDGEDDYYAQVIEAVLHDAIDRVGDDRHVKSDERREGFRELLGIGLYLGGGIMRRRDEAAPKFGLGSGESLRNDKRGDRKVIDLLIEELLEHLLTLAEEHHFSSSALQSWTTFYPDRPVYDYNSLSYDHGRYGALDGRPVFNSFINTPSYGDERAFFDGRRNDHPTDTNYDPIIDVTDGSKTVVLRMYVDNMAYVDLDDPYRTIAKGARVRVHLPTATATVLRARGYIWADNADMVEDTVDLIGNEAFRVVYVPGSAVLQRHRYEYGLSDSIVEEEGALIGHSIMDGFLPAGNQFEYTALVKVMVRVITGDTATATV